MANFATSALVKAQAQLISKFKNTELRFRDPVVHKLFLRNTAIMTPDYQMERTREDRTVETNYFNRTSRSLGSARSHNHTGSQGDSSVLTPSWSTKTDKFSTSEKLSDNKIYTMAELHAVEMENSIVNFAEGLETVATAYLFANRSGVNVATADGTFDAADDVFKITETTNGDQAMSITQMVMDVNKYQGVNLSVVCDSISYRKFLYQSAQGNGNSSNTSFQFMGIEFIHDSTLTAAAAGLVGAYSKGFWIVVPEGTVAALPWIPIQNRMGVNYGNISAYGQIQNPIDGLTYAVHTYNTAIDGTATGGYTQDVQIQTEISLDIAYQTAPLTTATESALMAFALV